MNVAERKLLAREATISAVLAATLAALLLWGAPPGIDWAAHAYQRTFLLQHGFSIWNNFWYAGRYSFITYSVLYYPLAALLGIRILALASIATAAFAFSIVVFRQWGPSSRLSSRSFAVLWVGIVGAAAFPFALGISFALLSLWALQEGRRGRFAVGAVLTLAASPLSFAFLVVALAGIVLARRSLRDARLQIIAVCACIAAELVLYRLFGSGGTFPYGAWQLMPSLVFGVLGLVVTRDVPAAKSLRGFFWIYLAVCIVAYLVPTSVGSNLERLRYLALPLALMVAALRSWRPLWLLVPVVALAATWNITPIWSTYARASTDPESARSYWQPAIAYFGHHLSAAYRVEVVDTAEHWSAAYFPDAGIPIVRGWYRQSDFPQNELLYDSTLGARTYDAWLRRMAVAYVVVTDAPVDYSARNEEALVRSGHSGLVPVKRFRHLTIYALPHPTPLVTGPGNASVVSLLSQRLVVALDARGTYRVRIRWSPFWRTSSGCVSKTPDGMTQVSVATPGFVELNFGVNVKRSLETLAGKTPAAQCASGNTA
ncbi:MAG TPA: hypothetical protein VFA97_07430 [Gaiellaceae bacterium]|nr:hypothetical protein [Gaiellaceae bacterium]